MRYTWCKLFPERFTTVHDLFIVGVPMLVILAGILLNRNDIKELRSEFRSEIKELRTEIKDVRTEIKDVRTEIKDVRSEIKDVRSEISDLRSESGSLRSDMMAQHAEVLVRLATIDADLRQFYHLNGRLEGRIDALEKRA